MKRIFRDYSLAVVLGALFLASWVAQAVFQYFVTLNEALSHSEKFVWSDFWNQFLASTFENWQSEFLQLLSFVVLTTYYIYKGSHESKDSQDRLEAKVDEILVALKDQDSRIMVNQTFKE